MKTKLIAVPIPVQYKWMAVDYDGERRLLGSKPSNKEWEQTNIWFPTDSIEPISLGFGDKPKDWRNTLERIVEIEWV